MESNSQVTRTGTGSRLHQPANIPMIRAMSRAVVTYLSTVVRFLELNHILNLCLIQDILKKSSSYIWCLSQAEIDNLSADSRNDNDELR